MKNVNAKTFWLCIGAGVLIRFILMIIANKYFHSIDFANFCVTGEIAASGKNVYASTSAYNYGPILFILLGFFHKIAAFFSDSVMVFRILFVSVLTLADFFIAKLAAKKAGNFWGIVFFLNPISLIVTGTHHQFDNVAVAIAAYGVYCLEKSSQANKINYYDLLGILLLSLSLITKHVLWAFPLWILFNKKIASGKKFFYAFIPPVLFLLSFAPYWHNGAGGIIQNVFLYRSGGNFPLLFLGIINNLGIHVPFQDVLGLPIFILFMLSGAYIFRDEKIFNLFLLYTIAQVCFSSGMANQYFAIPCMAVIILLRWKSALYFIPGIMFLFLCYGSRRLPLILSNMLAIDINSISLSMRCNIMYTILAWCLVFCLVYYYRHNMSR